MSFDTRPGSSSSASSDISKIPKIHPDRLMLVPTKEVAAPPPRSNFHNKYNDGYNDPYENRRRPDHRSSSYASKSEDHEYDDYEGYRRDNYNSGYRANHNRDHHNEPPRHGYQDKIYGGGHPANRDRDFPNDINYGHSHDTEPGRQRERDRDPSRGRNFSRQADNHIDDEFSGDERPKSEISTPKIDPNKYHIGIYHLNKHKVQRKRPTIPIPTPNNVREPPRKKSAAKQEIFESITAKKALFIDDIDLEDINEIDEADELEELSQSESSDNEDEHDELFDESQNSHPISGTQRSRVAPKTPPKAPSGTIRKVAPRTTSKETAKAQSKASGTRASIRGKEPVAVPVSVPETTTKSRSAQIKTKMDRVEKQPIKKKTTRSTIASKISEISPKSPKISEKVSSKTLKKDAKKTAGKTKDTDKGNRKVIIKIADEQGLEFILTVSESSKIKAIADYYAMRKNIKVNRLVLLIDGDRLRLNDTVKYWDLEDYDIIDIFDKTIGG